MKEITVIVSAALAVYGICQVVIERQKRAHEREERREHEDHEMTMLLVKIKGENADADLDEIRATAQKVVSDYAAGKK
jgi:tRNA(Ser,Leu) C12 N-acetylase TAN1